MVIPLRFIGGNGHRKFHEHLSLPVVICNQVSVDVCPGTKLFSSAYKKCLNR